MLRTKINFTIRQLDDETMMQHSTAYRTIVGTTNRCFGESIFSGFEGLGCHKSLRLGITVTPKIVPKLKRKLIFLNPYLHLYLDIDSA